MQTLQLKVLPYLLFFITPVLGRMSDRNEGCRVAATNVFAAMVKMIPLEVRPFNIIMQ